MSTVEQTTTVPNSAYVPISERQPDYGKAVEDRTPTQRHVDNQFTPAPAQTGGHPLDSRIEEFERLAEQEGRKDHLQPAAKRIAGYFKDMKERDLDSKEAKAAERKHFQSVAEQLARLAELRTEMVEGEGWRVSQIVAVDQAAKQFGYGCDLDKAATMLAEIEADFESTLAERDTELQAEIFGLQNKVAALQAKRRKPEPTNHENPEDALYVAARAEWDAAREAGNSQEATKLRAVYFAERFKREQGK